MKKVLVIGAARSGIAAAKLLQRHGYRVTITDQKEIPEKEQLKEKGIEVYDQGHPDMLKTIPWDFIVKNPGIPYHAPFIYYFVQQKVDIITEIELAYRYGKYLRYGAITGTNGKTTITSMLYAMLKKKGEAIAAGNIGLPLSEYVYEHEDTACDVALELSNFQLLGIDTFTPQVSVVCNLAPDHLDYMKDVEAYYESKMRIYKNCTKEHFFLRNVDDPLIMRYAQNIPCSIIDFSLVRQDVELYRKNGVVYFKDTPLFQEAQLKIVGEYNLSNAMIAACMAYILGVSLAHIQEVIATFAPIEHRLEYVGEKQGVRFYNDSKATNPHATAAALAAFHQKIILLAGGYDKGISFDELNVYDRGIKHCFSFGQTKEQFSSVFSHVTINDTLQTALQKAIEMAEEGDCILLSPACASYDQFHSYEERGKIFKELVKQYIKE